MSLSEYWYFKVLSLGADLSEENILELKRLLKVEEGFMHEESMIPRLASYMLLKLGDRGISEIVDCFRKGEKLKHDTAILDTLFSVSIGKYSVSNVYNSSFAEIELPAITPEIKIAARRAIHEIFSNSLEDPELFWSIAFFIQLSTMFTRDLDVVKGLAAVFRDTSIRVNQHILSNFEDMLSSDLPKEAYQVFLKKNPVFLDPLAVEIVPKQRLGDDYITDFVVRRANNEYVLVEIERPDTIIFTGRGEFSSYFTHAHGQVTDFQEWVESNIAYARTKMPGISAPSGLLIIGRSRGLDNQALAKLRRHNINQGGRVKVVTFDDVYISTKAMYENLIS